MTASGTHASIGPQRAGSLRDCAARFLDDARGASAVEFAMIGWPLVMLLLVIIEIALMFWMGHALDNAVEVGARRIATNTVAGPAGQPQSDLVREEICRHIGAFFNCATVRIELSTFASIQQAAVTQPVDPTTRDWRSGFGSKYECPRDGSIVVLQAAVEFITFSGLTFGNASLANGNRVLQSAFTFRMEDGLSLPAQCNAR